MSMTSELKAFLLSQGAVLVGMGDMTGVENAALPVGISVAVALPKPLVNDLLTAPTEEYHHLYHALNSKLNEIVLAGEAWLKERGYEAYAQTTNRVKTNEERISPLPHKTVATRAGIGWIGKNCLLVTPQYGSAVRLSSLLTNAPLECSEPVNESRCGECEECVRCCPAQALTGKLWKVGVERREIVDAQACNLKQKEIMKKATGIDAGLCGKCFAVCPYVRAYVES